MPLCLERDYETGEGKTHAGLTLSALMPSAEPILREKLWDSLILLFASAFDGSQAAPR